MEADAAADGPKPKSRQPWYQLRLRTKLLAGTLILGLLAGFGMSLYRARVQRACVDKLRANGATVVYDDHSLLFDFYFPASNQPYADAPHLRPVPDWLRARFGEDLFSNVVDVSYRASGGIDEWPPHILLDDETLYLLKPLIHVAFFWLSWCPITDAGLRSLPVYADLQDLHSTLLTLPTWDSIRSADTNDYDSSRWKRRRSRAAG